MRVVSTMWTLRTARAFIAKIQPWLKEVGWFAALGGGVLNHGKSDHDLDLVLVPYDSSDAENLDAVRAVFQACRCTLSADVHRVHARWRTLGSKDCKHVEVWRDALGRRIDLIIPSRVVRAR